MIKKTIKNLLHTMGYDLVKSNSITVDKNQKRSAKPIQPIDNIADSYLYTNYSSIALEERKFYNIGAGNFFHPYWTNVDYGTDWYKESQKNPFIEYNLMKCEPLPLEDNTAEIIYTSHTIEHVTNEAVLNLFKEAYRTIKPGGGIRIVCPDARLLYDTIATNDLSFWKPYHEWIDFKDKLSEVTVFDFFVRELATSRCRFYQQGNSDNVLTLEILKELYEKLDYRDFCEQVCSGCCFRDQFPGDHINWWDENKVKDCLKQAGFTNIYISRYGQSKLPPLRNTNLFDNSFFMIALYIEARK
ncbi:hypothetical protein PCC8801_0297 [Rippkaea orientalis PCC 8801]|uniref:Methyltransferase type 11 domain-containing protein n=1 Tax=Rippkaea orientalis (strain PCC 8801 / RF-1) TaxID=41431 RepID=B7K377_RIPO1|nr:methyltransferase domain-containing protein [Rippkaea orientalis]ACK64397.1 hypothetical protein PCC8801_0297 [Rippkaea orientalis PCC 8801]